MKAFAAAALAVLSVACPAGAQTFRRPVACSGCIANWYYFDDNGSSAGAQDWSCGSSSYDGHEGTDFSLAGGNAAIDNGYDVVAAADGTVVSALDGNYDHCTTCSASVDARCGTAYGFGYGNHVVIHHGSYRAIYAHMRNGSIRVAPGDVVHCGDVIGQIGSSGCTTGAHVHFESRPAGGDSTTAFDPFTGSCSATSPSRWTDQGPYRGLPGATCGAASTCPAGTYPIWTCNAALTARERCTGGMVMTEQCPWGCVSMPTGTDDVCAAPPDADGDGFTADVDCNDTDPTIHPGAVDPCGDGVDQNCDGVDPPCADGSQPDLDASALRADAGPGGGRGGPLASTCACRASRSRATLSPWMIFALGLLRRRRRSGRKASSH